MKRSRGIFPVLVLALLAASSPAIADADSETSGEFNPDLARLYHPLEAGMRWVYRIEEGDDTYEQKIEMKYLRKNGQYLLEVKSRLRRTKYRISRQGNQLLLHEVQARFSFLPIHRSQKFTPPLPFLSFDGQKETEWEWVGRSRGFGPTLIDASYTMQFSDEKEWPDSDSEILVKAFWRTEEGDNAKFQARYGAGVGLVSVEAEGYRKTLIAFRRTEPEGR